MSGRVPDDPELERRLRRALHEQAEQVRTDPDALRTIRQRTSHRRVSWLWPGLAAAAAGLAVVAAVTVPGLVRDGSSSHNNRGTAASSGRTPPATATSPSPPDRSTPAPTPTPSPQATSSGLQTTAAPAAGWPYLRADTAAARHDAQLYDPDQLAVAFVREVRQTDVKLVARTTDQTATTLHVAVSRADTARPISRVALTRIDTGVKPVYAVTSASSTSLTVVPPTLSGDRVAVRGALADTAGVANVWATVLQAGDDRPHGQPLRWPPQPTGRPATQWRLDLVPSRSASGFGLAVAYTVDADGNLLDLTATPTR